MIYNFIQYAVDKNDKGKAQNECFKLLKENDWAILMDADLMYTTPHWLKQCYDAIEKNPHIKLFGCYANKPSPPSYWQHNGADPENHDMNYHIAWGEKTRQENGDKIKFLKPPEKLIGYWLLLEKATWERVGGFCNGHLGTDDDMHDKVTNLGMPVGIIEGLYVYHRYRI